MVIFQLKMDMATRVTPTLMALPMTELKVSVKACWAPRTSLLSLDINAPVWVRVKKAMGMRWMWVNTRFRMSNMRLSPTRDEIQRSHSPRRASKTAREPYGEGEPQHHALGRAPAGQFVDDGPGQQWVCRAHQGIDDDEHQEHRQHPPVGPGKGEDAPHRPLGQLVVGDLAVLAHRAHDAPARPSHARMHHEPTLSRSEAKAAGMLGGLRPSAQRPSAHGPTRAQRGPAPARPALPLAGQPCPWPASPAPAQRRPGRYPAKPQSCTARPRPYPATPCRYRAKPAPRPARPSRFLASAGKASGPQSPTGSPLAAMTCWYHR